MDCKSYFNAIAPQWDAMRQGFFSTAVQHNRWLGVRLTQLEDRYRAAGLADVTVRLLHENSCVSSCGCGDPAKIPIFIASGRRD